MKCKFCKHQEFKKEGFFGYNQRFMCLNCESRFIPNSSEKFELYPRWMKKKEFE